MEKVGRNQVVKEYQAESFTGQKSRTSIRQIHLDDTDQKGTRKIASETE